MKSSFAISESYSLTAPSANEHLARAPRSALRADLEIGTCRFRRIRRGGAVGRASNQVSAAVEASVGRVAGALRIHAGEAGHTLNAHGLGGWPVGASINDNGGPGKIAANVNRAIP